MAELQRFGISPGLERIHALLKSTARPDNGYPIVLIGGTNGKGSTCEFLARHLATLPSHQSHSARPNRRIGLYTSPHLYRWNERIRIISADVAPSAPGSLAPFPDAISDSHLDSLFDEARIHIDAVTEEHGQPTEFEVLTFLGLWHFSRQHVDAAVVEVGLGGKWDATNVTNPLVSVVTHVALDHCDRLGSTYEEIARDKVEIARPGRVLITADTRESVLRIFRDYSDEIGARLWTLRRPEYSNDATALSKFLQAHAATEDAGASAPGWQAVNAYTAHAAAWALNDALGQHQAPFSKPQFTVPGRAEIIHEGPVILLDGANNPDGAARLSEYLQEKFANRRLIFVAGISADKDWPAMVEQWSLRAAMFIATQAQHPRAARAEALAEAARNWCSHTEAVPNVMDALRRAMSLATPDDVICVSGSFFVLAEIDRQSVNSAN
jgi:dihydrofolate synthase/folylpolyglutamate synthase